MKTHVLLFFSLSSALLATPATYNATSGNGMRVTGGGLTQSRFQDTLPGLDGPFFDAQESEIQFQSIVLASEVDEGNGFKRLGFTITLQNTGPGYYEEVSIEWEPTGPTWVTVGDAQSQTGPLWQGVGVPDTHGWMPDLIPNGTSTRTQPFEVRVPVADRNAAVADILAGKHLRPIGIELHRYTSVPVGIDHTTDEAFDSYSKNLVGHYVVQFTQSTPLLAALQPGQLLVESAYLYIIRRAPLSDPFAPCLSDLVASTDGGESTVREPPDFQPKRMLSTKIQKVVSVVQNGNGTVTVTLDPQDFWDVLDVGTIRQGSKQALDPSGTVPLRNLYRPPFDDSIISGSFPALQPESIVLPPPDRSSARLQFQGHPALEWGFHPWHMNFNDITFAGGLITLGGDVLLQAMHFEFKMRVRDGQPSGVTMTISSKAEMTMRLTAEPNSDNSNLGQFDKEKMLFNIPLAIATIPIGPIPVTITPQFFAKVGASVHTPTKIVIPINSSIEGGAVIKYNSAALPGQRVTYKPFHKVTPLEVTNPLLNDSLALTASAFAEAGIGVKVTVAEVATYDAYAGARAVGTFSLNPANQPWWSLDFGTAVDARMSVKIATVEVGDPLGVITNVINFANKNAGGPVQRGSGLPGGSPPGPFDPVSGGETRWARMAPVGAGGVKLARVTGTTEDAFAAVDGALLSPPIMRLDVKGNVLWAKGAPFIAAQRMSPTADGGLVFVGAGGTATIVWMDGSGNATHARIFQPQDSNNFRQVFYIGAIQAMPDGSVFVAGSIATPGDAHDPFLAKYDATKNLVFFIRYETTTMLESITGMCIHPGGDLILCGISDGGAAPSTRGGLLMRINTSGTLQWATRTLSPIAYNAVTCSPDGNIYAAGTFTRTITLDWPSILVARHLPSDGHLDFAVLVGENMGNEPPPPFSQIDNDVGKDYLAAGCTAWDDVKSITWTPNGLIVTGNTANLPDLNTRAPVTFCMNERMGVRWFTTHDGSASDDGIYDAVPTDQGILTAGYTKRWGTASNGDTQPALFTKLPKEARLDLPGTAKYLLPTVMALPPFDGYDFGSPTPPQGYQGEESITFSNAAQNVFSDTIPVPFFTDVGIPMSPPLQVDPSTGETVRTNFDLWRLQKFPGHFHSVVSTPLVDPDGDGISNFLEFAFGLNPHVKNAAPTGNHFNTFGQSMFSFPRIADPGLLYEVQASDDLFNWTPIYTSTGAANHPGVFEVPDPGPIVNGRRFYRLSISQ